MSIPLSGAAALGVAKLATRAVSESIQGTVGMVSSFAEVLAEKSSEQAGEPAASAAETPRQDDAALERASSTLRDLLSGWMRHFGMQGNEPIEVHLDPASDCVLIQSESRSAELSRSISDLQIRINTDDSLRRTIADSLHHLPGHRFTMSGTQVD